MNRLIFTLFLALPPAATAGACASNFTRPANWLDGLLARASVEADSADVREARVFIRAVRKNESRELAEYGHDFELLAFHPGVLARLPRFRTFLEANPSLRNGLPGEALAAFREDLGRVWFSRAIVIDLAELALVRERGFIPNFVRNGHGSEEDMYRWLARTGVGPAVDLHMSHAGARRSPFASYSQQSDLARLVAAVPEDRSRLRYVWRVELDVLDVVYISAHTGLIEEALAFGFVPPGSIENLGQEQGEFYHVSIVDMLEDRRFMGFSSHDSKIPSHDQPRVERAPRGRVSDAEAQ